MCMTVFFCRSDFTYKRFTLTFALLLLCFIFEPYSLWLVDCFYPKRIYGHQYLTHYAKLMGLGIKFRPNKPGSHATVEIGSDHLHGLLAEWQYYDNWDRPHRSHKGKLPIEALS
jgi:hypothetical protein